MPGPRNGAAVKSVRGWCILSGVNRSLTVPPETLRNALPDRPWKNLATTTVPMFRATAQGTIHTVKAAKAAR